MFIKFSGLIIVVGVTYIPRLHHVNVSKCEVYNIIIVKC